MIPTRRIFAAALALALIVFLPLRLALGFGDSILFARSVEGSIWGGRLMGAAIGGQPLGDLKAGLSPLHLFLGQVRVNVDGAFRGALIKTFSSEGANIEGMTLPLSRSFGALRLTSLEISQAHLRFRKGNCAEADGRVTVQVDGALGPQRLSGDLKCSGSVLAAELLSQSAMERLTLRFPKAGRYEAILSIRAADAEQATRLSAAGLRETASGHVVRISGNY